MHMTNLLSTNKVLKVSGTMTITDEVNRMQAEFTYGSVKRQPPRKASQGGQQTSSGKLKRFKTMVSSKLFGTSKPPQAAAAS